MTAATVPPSSPGFSKTTGPNPDQLKAIQTTEGPLLIIAGPGTGKTKTLVDRIARLITKKGVKPEELLVVTFTRKAAAELVTRVSNHLKTLNISINLNEMYLGTFHSICLRLLEDHREFTRLKRNFILLDDFDQQYFLYREIADFQAVPNSELLIGKARKSDETKQADSAETNSQIGMSRWDQAETLVKWLNKATEEALEVDDLLKAKDEQVRVLGALLQRYREKLNEQNALDFAHIQYDALQLLQRQPQVLEKLRAQLRYVMVDEYQDTNFIQDKLLHLLTEQHNNLCVVGDDDQSLYRFRGATVRNILEFKEQYPAGLCKQVKLVTNYRSHPDIIDFYNRWMNDQDWTDGLGKNSSGQVFRLQKQITPPAGKTFPKVPTVIKVTAEGEEAWYKEVHDFLLHLHKKGLIRDWNQVALLFRSVKNEKVLGLARYLDEHNIPVYSPRSGMFFERLEIRLMLGALLFLFPQYGEVRKWADNARLGIWDYYDQECLMPFAAELRKPENAELLRWCAAVAKQHLTLTQPTDYTFAGLFYQLLRFPLFSHCLDEAFLGSGVKDERPARNLAALSQLLGKFEYLHHVKVLTPEYLNQNLQQLFNQFFRYLRDGGINEYEDTSEYAPTGCVSFMTVHQAKGLEFPVVLVGSLNVVPRKQYTELDEILERGYLHRPPFEPLEQTKFYDFWRLYYTAYSRAQNLLVLTCHEKAGHGRSPSKYFAEYVEALPSWRDKAFKPQHLTLETLKPVDLKREYSFTSHITLFENCAEQYRFFRELEFAPIRTSPILFGTLVHQTIEDIHKTVLRGESVTLNTQRVSDWFEENYHYLTQRERVYLAQPVKEAALRQVLRYYERQRGDWSRIMDAEKEVSLVKDAYILTGNIDLITGEGGTVEIVDFKSEKKPDLEREREKIERYRRQLEVYAHIVEEQLGKQVTNLHLYYTSEEHGNPYISFPKDKRSIDRTISAFDEVVNRIEAKDFRIRERPTKLCTDCDMRHYCDAKNWKFRKD